MILYPGLVHVVDDLYRFPTYNEPFYRVLLQNLQRIFIATPILNILSVLVERLTCVAKWKEGNKRYFVALVNSKHSQWADQRDRYQCFLYEDISNNMKMAQA